MWEPQGSLGIELRAPSPQGGHLDNVEILCSGDAAEEGHHLSFVALTTKSSLELVSSYAAALLGDPDGDRRKRFEER